MKYSEIWYGALLTSREIVELLNKEHDRVTKSGLTRGDGSPYTVEKLEKMNRELKKSHLEVLFPCFISVECNQDLCCYPKNQETRYLVGNRIDPTESAEYVKCFFPLRLEEKNDVKCWLEEAGFHPEFLFVNQHCWCT